MFALYELLDFRVIASFGQQMVVKILFVVVLGLKRSCSVGWTHWSSLS